MRDKDRFKLRFGPYKTPKYKYGQSVECLRFGEVIIIGTSDGFIPWPLARRPKHRGRASAVLYWDLVKAVQQESPLAIHHWFGISFSTIKELRKVLSVPLINQGTLQLKLEHCQEDWAVQARKKAWSKARDPERCEKIAAAKRGKKRPPEIAKKMRTAFAGRKHSDQTRQQMSESHKKRGTRPPWLNKPWEPWDDALFAKPLT